MFSELTPLPQISFQHSSLCSMMIMSVPWSVFVAVPVVPPRLPSFLEWVFHGLPRPLPHPHLLFRQETELEGRLDLLGVHLRPDDDKFLEEIHVEE